MPEKGPDHCLENGLQGRCAGYDKSMLGLYRERSISFGCPLKSRLPGARDREKQLAPPFILHINGFKPAHQPSRAFNGPLYGISKY